MSIVQCLARFTKRQSTIADVCLHSFRILPQPNMVDPDSAPIPSGGSGAPIPTLVKEGMFMDS